MVQETCEVCGRTLDLCLCGEEEESVEAVTGGVSEAGETNVLAELLLELTVETRRLRTLLEEADEDDFKAVRTRYRALLDEYESLPTKPRGRVPMGFRAPAKRRR